jgi:hypothetical protein
MARAMNQEQVEKMTRGNLSYNQLLEANNLMQACGDETYWLCLTRTVQESKLFPVSSYILLSYLNAFYRYPSLLRKIEAQMPAERIADRARNMGIKIQNSAVGWCLPNFYLLGREWLLSMGFIRPQDGAEDVVYVMDFWKRYQLAWHRNDGHMTNREFGHRGQFLPDRRLEIFESDMFECQHGDELHEAAHIFLATVSQYGFLVSCESRTSLSNSGPYKISGDREMLVRDFMDLAEGSIPWLDDVAADIPYNNLTVTMAAKGCHFSLVDDWGSFESKPEFTAERLVGVGLYTSDTLTEGFMPVSMESPEKLTETFKELTVIFRDATTRLWRRIAGWSRDQMIDAGAITYYAVIKDLAHVAGVFDIDDWATIDPRAERFRPILNDEYSGNALGELVGGISLPTQQISPYAMMQHSNAPTRVITPIPYSILAGEDYVPSCGAILPGASHLAPKNSRYRTSRGVLDLSEYNRLSASFVPELCQDKYRYLCETWLKYNYHSDLADELYKLEQRHSRTLKNRGVGERKSKP